MGYPDLWIFTVLITPHSIIKRVYFILFYVVIIMLRDHLHLIKTHEDSHLSLNMYFIMRSWSCKGFEVRIQEVTCMPLGVRHMLPFLLGLVPKTCFKKPIGEVSETSFLRVYHWVSICIVRASIFSDSKIRYIYVWYLI